MRSKIEFTDTYIDIVATYQDQFYCKTECHYFSIARLENTQTLRGTLLIAYYGIVGFVILETVFFKANVQCLAKMIGYITNGDRHVISEKQVMIEKLRRPTSNTCFKM